MHLEGIQAIWTVGWVGMIRACTMRSQICVFLRHGILDMSLFPPSSSLALLCRSYAFVLHLQLLFIPVSVFSHRLMYVRTHSDVLYVR